jgi:RNA-directed DNA polymerase
MKPANKMSVTSFADHSGVGGAKESSDMEFCVEPDRTATQSAASRLTGPMRVHEAAKRNRSQRFDNLLCHITPQRLLQAYTRLNKKSARGVDGESWNSYGKKLPERLKDLHHRIHSLKYTPQAVKRIYIPKANGEKRPIGITTVEDKIVQQAMVWILESIYEADFLGFSYGFRPERSQHGALDATYVAITQKKVSWVLDADISKFFDTIDHKWMMKMLAHRVADKRVLMLIERTLKAGVIDEDRFFKTEAGTPQGAVISPLLANIYLHYVLDLWAHQWRNKYARGECYIVRYADDSVFCFQYRSDGERFLRELTDRLNKFGLALNQSKTQLIEFGRFAISNFESKNGGSPDTFDFLGFTHYCSKRQGDGGFKLGRKTIAKKMKAKLIDIKKSLRERINQDVYTQGRWLKQVVQGFFNYHAIPGNGYALDSFKTAVTKLWLRSLRRRSQKSTMNWKRLARLVILFIPSVRTIHPYPNQRLSV